MDFIKKRRTKLFAIDVNSNRIISTLPLNTILKSDAVNPSTDLIVYWDGIPTIFVIIRTQLCRNI